MYFSSSTEFTSQPEASHGNKKHSTYTSTPCSMRVLHPPYPFEFFNSHSRIFPKINLYNYFNIE